MKKYFHSNGFPIHVLDNQIKKFMDNIFVKRPVYYTADKKKLYHSLPYFGSQSEKLKLELNQLLSKYFMHIDFKLVLVNNFSIGSLFKFKDQLPKSMLSSIVYKYSCAQCASEYIGSTIRTLKTRVAEHAGRSYRTDRPLARPSHSSIRDHLEHCDSQIREQNFSVIGSTSNPTDLRILESLHIFKHKPNLNDMQSAFPLKIIGH